MLNKVYSTKFRQNRKNADDLDSVLNLRVNSALKQEFSRICKLNQSSASSELKRYMLKIVKQRFFIILNAQ